MNLGERILMALYGFCVAAASIIIAVMPFDFIGAWNIDNLAYGIRGSWIVSIVGIVFFILSVTILWLSFRRDKKKSIQKFTNLGEVRVSFSTIEGLALKTIRQYPNVKDTKVSSKTEGEQLIIGVRAVVTADTNIPEITADIQSSVKEYVEKYTGIVVKQVQVQIDGIWEINKSRVQ
jgi:uncharacterized alkaline shock family protein YloU